MQAVTLTAPGALALTTRPEPDAPGPGEAIVAPVCVGLCGTDFHAYAGRQNFFTYPRVLGHEIAAEVVACGDDVTGVQVGDRCAVLPYLECGSCSACLRGNTNCCERLEVLGVTTDGALTDALRVPASSLFPCPGMSDEAIALVETLGIGLHAVERSGLSDGEAALVVGAGPIGLAIAASALGRGADVTIIDVNPARIDMARRLLGVPILLSHTDLETDVRDLCGGGLPTTVFEATGSAASMRAAAHLVGPTGTLVLVGHSSGEITFDNPVLHKREMTIRTSRNALAREWPHLIDRVQRGELDATRWVNRRMPLHEVPERFAEWADPTSGVLKGVVDIGAQRADVAS